MRCKCGTEMDEHFVNSYSEEYPMYGCESCGAFVPATYRQITEADLDG